MDRVVIDQKLESLRRYLRRIEEKRPPNARVLKTDADLQDILAMNLTRAVQVCVDIGAHLIATLDVPPPDTMGQTFDTLARAGILSAELAGRMKKSVGFRNIAVHDYEAIDWDLVYEIAKDHTRDFVDFAKAVATRLDA
jgi:uncharacterized protein YutE (UPF0331/DUF86 family)